MHAQASPSSSKNRHPLLCLCRLFLPETHWLVAGFLLTLLTLALGLALLCGAAILALVRNGTIDTSSMTSATFALASSLGGIAGLVIFVRLFALLRTVSRYFERLITHSAMFRILARLRVWFFLKAVPLSPARLGFSRSGDLLNRVTADIDALDSLYLRVLIPLTMLGILVISAIVFLAPASPALAAGVSGILAMFLFIVIWTTRGKVARASADMAEQLSDTRIHALDGVSGMADILANDAAHYQQSILTHATARLSNSQLVVARATAITSALAILALGTITTVSLLLAPDYLLVPVVVGLGILAEPLQQIPQAFARLGSMTRAAERVLQITSDSAPVCEPASPAPYPEGDGSICFDHVSLRYETRTTPSLDDICFTLNNGERLLLRGASGAGKSSLVKLLLKFSSPTEGKIMIGGVDLCHLDGDTLRRHIGYLSQQTNLLSGTVRDNLRLADPAATEVSINSALEAVDLADTIAALPEGLDTWIGEGGLLLSGGQARRLAMAQIVLKRAPVWVLDEPTEGLDSETAQAILATLGRLSDGHTVVFITHRPHLAAPMNLRRTIVLDTGHISLDSLSPATK